MKHFSIIQSLVNNILVLASNQQMLAPSSTYLNTPPDTGEDERIIPIPLAREPANIIPIPLHKPVPTCLEWDVRKNRLQHFLAATEEPADKMQDFMSRQEEAYKSRTGLSLLAHEKDWPSEYRKAFDGLNTLITARNNATTELKEIQDTERQDTLVAALTEGQFIMTYCQKELER